MRHSLVLLLLASCQPSSPAVDTDTDLAPCTRTPTAVSATVVDFQRDTPLADLTVSIHTDDDPSGAVDHSVVTDADGAFGSELTSCIPTTIVLEAVPDERVRTVHPHVVLPPEAATLVLDSYDSQTIGLAASICGVELDGAAAVVTGRVIDAAGLSIAGAEIEIWDRTSATSSELCYFREAFPDADATATSEDGLFIALNAPVHTLEVRAIVAGQTVASSEIVTMAASAVTLELGPTGTLWPDACEASCR